MSDWPAPDYWCTICDAGAEGCQHAPEDAPDWMHNKAKPGGLAIREETP